MKEQIRTEEIKKWNRESVIFSILMIAMIVSAVPLFLYVQPIGIVAWIVLAGVTMYDAGRIEKQKKKYDIQTYKEIVAFTEGKRLDEIEKNREYGKRPYQQIMLAILTGVITLVVTGVMFYFLK